MPPQYVVKQIFFLNIFLNDRKTIALFLEKIRIIMHFICLMYLLYVSLTDALLISFCKQNG